MRTVCLSVLLCLAGVVLLRAQQPRVNLADWAHPDTSALWIQPAQGVQAMPVWGHANGISVGIAPVTGLGGLMCVYTPYLGQPPFSITNYIALEPIPKGKTERGFSELEMSSYNQGFRGKYFWSADKPVYERNDGRFPARGVIGRENGKETLTVYLFSEPFDNGAKVYLRLRFTEGRPYEFELTAYKTDDSADLQTFILTATMGNKARLRTLYMNGYRKTAPELWPDYKESAFTPHAVIPAADMIRDKDGNPCFIAAPDEADPASAVYNDNTARHWKYVGKKATQYWIGKSKDPQLKGLVNGRYTYWASQTPIPGGISYENFELNEPFENGRTYLFGISPLSPDQLIKQLTRQ